MIPDKLLNNLRNVSSFYHLPTNVEIIRTINETDGIGGIKTSNRIIATTKCRLISKVFSEEQEGGGITGNSKWLLVLPYDVNVQADDKVKVLSETNDKKYYLVINTDSSSTEGLFTNCEVIERFN